MLFGGSSFSLSGGKLSGRPPAAAENIMALATLTEIRDAIAAYRAANDDAVPGADGSSTTLKSDLQPYIDPFPACPVGNQNADVNMMTTVATVSGVQGWSYCYSSPFPSQLGKIIINSTETDPDGTPWNFY